MNRPGFIWKLTYNSIAAIFLYLPDLRIYNHYPRFLDNPAYLPNFYLLTVRFEGHCIGKAAVTVGLKRVLT